MVLNISSSMVLILFVGLFMPILLAHKSYFYGRGSYAFLNKSNIECLQGVCLILVLLGQVIDRVSRPDVMLQCLSTIATGALAVYLFLMGVELRKFSLYPRRVVKKRMHSSAMRLCLMFVAGNFLMALVQIYLGEEMSFLTVIRHTVKGQFLDGTAASLIITLFVFYLLCGWIQNLKVVSILGLVAGWPGIFVILGMWTSRYQKIVFMILKKQLLNLSLICGILVMLSVRWPFLLPLAALLGTLIILMKVQFKSKLFRLITQFSIPLYVLQLPILYLVFYSSEPRDSGLVLVTLGISFSLVLLCKAMLLTEAKSFQKVKNS